MSSDDGWTPDGHGGDSWTPDGRDGGQGPSGGWPTEGDGWPDDDGRSANDEPGEGQMVGWRDPSTGLVTLRMWVVGPAGDAPLSLADGTLELAVDHAEPDIVTGLTIDPDEPRSVEVADHLLEGRWSDVRDAAGERPRVLWRSDSGGYGTAPTLPGLHGLARAALLRAEIERTDASALARALGMIELANLVDEDTRRLGATPGASALWRAGATRLVELDLSWTGELDRIAARDIDTVLLRAVKGLYQVDPNLERRVAEVRARLRPRIDDPGGFSPGGARGRHPRSMPLAAAPAAAPAALPAGLDAAHAPPEREEAWEAPAAAALLEALPPEPTVAVTVVPPLEVTFTSAERHGDLMEVTVRGGLDPEATWLRVFCLTDALPVRPVLVALAPFQRTGYAQARATALVPVGMGSETLHADVTLSPEGPWRPPRLGQVAAAVDAGRRASRAERRRDRAEAWELWQVCAERWAGIGDDAREGQARALAAGQRSRRTGGPRGLRDRQPGRAFTTDLVD